MVRKDSHKLFWSIKQKHRRVVRKRGRGVVKSYTSCFLLLFVAFRHLLSNIPTRKPDSENCLHITNSPEQATNVLPLPSLSLLKPQTCSHPKLYFSLTKREVTVPSKHQEDAVKRTELSRHWERLFFKAKFWFSTAHVTNESVTHRLHISWAKSDFLLVFSTVKAVLFTTTSLTTDTHCAMGISHTLGGFPKVFFTPPTG